MYKVCMLYILATFFAKQSAWQTRKLLRGYQVSMLFALYYGCILLVGVRGPNKLVATLRQDSIRPCRAHAVLSMCCNHYLYMSTYKYTYACTIYMCMHIMHVHVYTAWSLTVLKYGCTFPYLRNVYTPHIC